MRITLRALLVLVSLSYCSCQKAPDLEKERAAIVKVLNDEGRLFAAGDLQSLASLHVRSDQDARLAGTDLYEGWPAIEKLLAGYIAENKKNPNGITNPQNIKEHIVLKVNGNSAWLTCENIWRGEVKGVSQELEKNRQISFFEKIDGEWKFSFNAFVALPQAN